nr:hypothetical protein [Cyanobium sp. LEGE 06113]
MGVRHACVLQTLQRGFQFSLLHVEARWFIDPTAVFASKGNFFTEAIPGAAGGASAHQKNATAFPPPQSKKKCWPPSGSSTVLNSGMPSTSV